MAGRRLIFDISTLLRARGQPVGIVRVVRGLADWALEHRPDVVFAVYDPDNEAMRAVRPEWLKAIVRGEVQVDISTLGPIVRGERAFRHRLTGLLRTIVLWQRNPRLRLIVALERRRLRARGAAARRIERIQARLSSRRIVRDLMDRDGQRRTLLPYDMATASKLELEANDIVLQTGSGWGEIDTSRLAELKQSTKFKLVLLCHDIIAVMHPEFFRDHDAAVIRRYFEAVFPLTDLAIFTSKRVESDAIAYCAAAGKPLSKTRVAGLGVDLARSQPSMTPPAGLNSDRYAMIVSTIEPRKNHRLLFEVWKRLLAEGVPQAHGFKLVFAGRRGWLVDDLLTELDAHPGTGQSLLMLATVDDETLSWLYHHAAFCVYPSLYEGYGLPVVEAFRHGKAVMASNRGAIPEVVKDLSPCLDPADERAWHDLMRRWIEDPSSTNPYERAIQTQFRHPTIAEHGAMFFEAIDQSLGQT